jgi:hypothetical protein
MLLGIVIFTKLVQLENAAKPMLVALLPSVTSDKLVQF